MPEIDNWIINLGAVVAALGVIVSAAWRWVIKPTYVHTIGAEIGCAVRQIEALAHDMAERLAVIDEQLRPNHGTSLRDSTDRIERGLAEHVASADRRFLALGIEVGLTNERLAQLTQSIEEESR